MIGRISGQAGNLLSVSVLAIGLTTIGLVTHPLSALAAPQASVATHVVVFESQGNATQHVTSAQSVGAFLKERGIVVGPDDYVHPTLDTSLGGHVTIDYTPAVAVKLITNDGTKIIRTATGNVRDFLASQGVKLGTYDVVRPSLDDPIAANETIRIAQVLKWISTQHRRVAARTVHVIDFSMKPGRTKVIAAGRAGERVTMVRYTQTNGTIEKHMESHLVRKPQERVIAEGVGTYTAFADFARRGLQKTAYIAANAVDMVATAYTAECLGCSGYTASGYRAGRGIVAVDPRVIPLGTKLYIAGYGFAIAGDTGGAIHGNRIDLGFNSLDDAVQFGRRVVKVYALR